MFVSYSPAPYNVHSDNVRPNIRPWSHVITGFKKIPAGEQDVAVLKGTRRTNSVLHARRVCHVFCKQTDRPARRIVAQYIVSAGILFTIDLPSIQHDVRTTCNSYNVKFHRTCCEDYATHDCLYTVFYSDLISCCSSTFCSYPFLICFAFLIQSP